MTPEAVLDAWEAAVEKLPAVSSALAVETAGAGCRFLFVALRTGCLLDDALRAEIWSLCLAGGKVPDAVYAVADLPRAADGQPMRGVVRRLLAGEPLAWVETEGLPVANPETLGYFEFLFNNL